jgi:hypothetical protein
MNSTNQHAIAIFTFIILVPLVYYIPPWVNQNLTKSHFFVTVISLAIIVPIISYIAMPLFKKSLTVLQEK